jgi:N-acetyl-1-D-myo-inositol-2-amino-2-deoxy-alpha-D-glucopyranoside deacetylase/mycothiol S-conjugate amidase
VHTELRVSEAAALRKEAASACHKSQLQGGPGRNTIAGRILRLFGSKEMFMRAQPPVNGKLKETDLFEGVN